MNAKLALKFPSIVLLVLILITFALPASPEVFTNATWYNDFCAYNRNTTNSLKVLCQAYNCQNCTGIGGFWCATGTLVFVPSGNGNANSNSNATNVKLAQAYDTADGFCWDKWDFFSLTENIGRDLIADNKRIGTISAYCVDLPNQGILSCNVTHRQVIYIFGSLILVVLVASSCIIGYCCGFTKVGKHEIKKARSKGSVAGSNQHLVDEEKQKKEEKKKSKMRFLSWK
ncbi:hypothetical protein BKA69DRAFT_1108137 [Paraphysoderma sedebokerense]|nr:hypothetical protein BKA69DRAFT_1108137 [Paraphysoderma sedebokerense]